MTVYAILSDVHGRTANLERVLEDARQRGAEVLIALGDIGSDPCYDLLREVNAQAVFGNYEVSGWDRLRPENQQWVQNLPGVLVGEDWLAAHAVPYFPPGVGNVHQVLDHLLEHQLKWRALFPDLVRDEHARLLTIAELEARGKRVFFHGHTHLQRVWRLGSDNAMDAVSGPTIQLDASGRYIVGAGSVGQPTEGIFPCYALYNSSTQEIQLVQVK